MNFQTTEDRIFSLGENGDLLAEVTFPSQNADIVDINHVYVAEELRGHGIASRLMELAYSHLKIAQKRIIPTCPYAIAWFSRHPGNQDLLDRNLRETNADRK